MKKSNELIVKGSYFESDLKKKDIIDLAVHEAETLDEWHSPLEAQIILKKIKLYIDTLLSANEPNAMYEAEKEKHDFVHVVHGGPILDYSHDIIYDELNSRLKERKALLDLAFKQKDDIFDNEGLQVPKVKVKGYRKDHLQVKL